MFNQLGNYLRRFGRQITQSSSCTEPKSCDGAALGNKMHAVYHELRTHDQEERHVRYFLRFGDSATWTRRDGSNHVGAKVS